MYHVRLKKEAVGEYAILTGDPKRVTDIAKYLGDSKQVADNREFKTCLGYINGVKVNVTSVGIGGPSMAIAVEELYKLGCRNFIRIGTCGGINLDVKAGDIIIPTSAVRQEGTGYEYLPVIYPAVSDFNVTASIKNAAENLNMTYHIGTIQSKDSFYGEMEPERMPVREKLLELWEIYKQTGVLASEMECATLFLLGSVLKVRTGAILLCIWNEERKKAFSDTKECHETEKMYKLAVEAVKQLI